MAEYKITIKPSARVAAKIKALAVTPRPAGVKKLEGEPSRWRVRIGDWRVIYAIDDAAHVIDVIYVRHRSKAYE